MMPVPMTNFKSLEAITANPLATTSAGSGYTISLVMESEPTINLDELECIFQQMAAIQAGWGHDYEPAFTVEDVEEVEVATWQWSDLDKKVHTKTPQGGVSCSGLNKAKATKKKKTS